MDENEINDDELLPENAISPPQPTNTNTSDLVEVHYEPHFKNNHHKKHLKEYAKEFTMIFFAVFMGFLAESWREHISERSREKEYIKGFIADIKADSIGVSEDVIYMKYYAAGLDSIVHIINDGIHTRQDESKLAQMFFRYTGGLTTFTTHDVTLDQVKSSGGMAIISKNHAADSLLRYYSTRDFAIRNDDLKASYAKMLDIDNTVINYKSYYNTRRKIAFEGPLIFSKDPEKVNALLNQVQLHASLLLSTRHDQLEFQERFKHILAFLRKTYNIEND